MSHLRPVTETPVELTVEEAHAAFKTRIYSVRIAYQELLTEVGHPSIPNVAFGPDPVNRVTASMMRENADRIAAAAAKLRSAAHDITAIWDELKP